MLLFLINIRIDFMSGLEVGIEQMLFAAEVQKLQNQALKRVKNLKRRPKSSVKKQQENQIRNKSHQKISISTPDKKYSIQKVHQKNEIEFVSNMIHSKELTRKMCARIKLQKFSFQHVIGCGMFGKVWKAEDRTTHKLYAIKEVSKALIIMKKGLGTVLNERQIITQLNFHLIPSLITSFQTEHHLYLILPLMQKGDLRYHITKYKEFSQKEVRFFIACIVSVLEYLRGCGIVHRDIKPENLLLDQNGYLYLSDFGVAQKCGDVLQGGCCGTPAYMAPEVIFQKEYSFSADYYALGVLLYEMMTGQRPYMSSSRQQLRQLMPKHSAHIKKSQIPQNWSIQSADFANKLLHRSPNTRLGHTNISQIKTHPWLKDFPWHKLQHRQLISPYCQPFNHWEVDYGDMFQGRNLEEIGEIGEVEDMLAKGELQELFQCFSYDQVQKSVQYTTKPSFELKL